MNRSLLLSLLCVLSTATTAYAFDMDQEVRSLPCYPDCSLQEELAYSEELSAWQGEELGLLLDLEPVAADFHIEGSSPDQLYRRLAEAASGISDFPYEALRDQVDFFFSNSKEINNKNYLVLIDFTQPSNKKRMFIFHTGKGTVTNHYTTHGVNSGKLYATRFSNIEGSLQSTLGFLVTGTTYYGSNGLSLNLHGLERHNSRAYERRIVVHKASYANPEYIRKKGMAGNSWGCPAVGDAEHYLVNQLAKGVLYYKYY